VCTWNNGYFCHDLPEKDKGDVADSPLHSCWLTNHDLSSLQRTSSMKMWTELFVVWAFVLRNIVTLVLLFYFLVSQPRQRNVLPGWNSGGSENGTKCNGWLWINMSTPRSRQISYDMIRYDIWYDTIWYIIWYDMIYDTIWYMIW
jgi:hypothetical protein